MTANQSLWPIDPCTGLPTGLGYPATEPEDVPGLAAELRASGGAETDASQDRLVRSRKLRTLTALIADRADEISQEISAATGKPAGEALLCEVLPAQVLVRHFAKHASSILRPRRIATFPLPQKSSRLLREPYGVVSIITPWNYPFGIAICQIAAALAAGNQVLWKPSELTPGVSVLAHELLLQSGFADNVRLAQGGEAVGAAAVSLADLVVFTGSTATGRKVQTQAAQRITPVLLELGGKDAFLVLPSADPEQAARLAVWGAMTNAGQVCASVERVFVHRQAAERFTAAALKLVRQIKVGSPNEHADMGPLISAEQRCRVQTQVQDALRRGANLLSGGHELDRPGFFYAPTVLTGVDSNMLIFREETFGPVLAIQVCESVEEMIAVANNSDYGLCASVFGAKALAKSVAARLQVGTVTINDLLFTYGLPNSPWGGHKQSGLGQTHGTLGLLAMTQIKEIAAPKRGLPQPYLGFPYQRGIHRLLRRVGRLLR